MKKEISVDSKYTPTKKENMSEQLAIDFSISASARQRKYLKSLPPVLKDEGQISLIEHIPNIDVSLKGTNAAVVNVLGLEPERTLHWLNKIVRITQIEGKRKAFIPSQHLDKLLCVLPPAHVTLDAGALAVARAIYANDYDLGHIQVTRKGKRLIAYATWKRNFQIKDAPWPVIATLLSLNIPVDIDEKAHDLLEDKMKQTKLHIAEAGFAGSTVRIKTSQPKMIEKLKLPGLSYDGPEGTGLYSMPILGSAPLLENEGIKISKKLEKNIKNATKRARPLKNIPDFPWELYPFQARDAGRAVRILQTTGGVLLAGDMGSGKTTVSLALMQYLKIWPALVVAPLAAFSTWARQLEDIGKNFYVASEAPQKSWDIIKNNNFDAVVISYDRLHSFIELIEQKHFTTILADELQRIRTPSSRRSRALRHLSQNVHYRIGLSGTPLQNRASDLLAPGAFLVPSEWTARATRSDLQDLYPGDPMEAVAEHLGTLMVRRKMSDTGVKLPGKTVHKNLVELTAAQQQALEDLQNDTYEAKKRGELTTSMHIFARLQKMRKIIAAPQSEGIAGRNPKVDTAVELVEQFEGMGRKCVVFTADRTSWVELGKEMEKIDIGWTGIWGSSSVKDRIKAEKDFHEDDNVKVFIGTVQSCAEALTLSPTGTVVIFLSMTYNPMDLAQAEARVYRMNQTNPVEIIYLHATASEPTLDDRMSNILEEKKALFSRIVDRETYENNTKVHYSMADFEYMLTGERTTENEKQEIDIKFDTEK